MTTAPASWTKMPKGYVIEVATVTTLQDAQSVVAALVQAMDDWLVDAARHDFAHQIIMHDSPSSGLPLVDETALHVDMRGGGYSHEDVVRALQPGWFWLRVAGMSGGEAVVRSWLAAVRRAYGDPAPGEEVECEHWEEGDVGIQLGESVVLPLALHDPAWLEDYAQMLALWDLSHEVNQFDAIHIMFATHGWSDAMRTLLIARVTVDGQHGLGQVFGDLRNPLGDVLSKTDFAAFYQDALMAFRAATHTWLTWPLNDDDKRSFSIDGPLAMIADSLPDDPTGAGQ